MRIRLIVTLLLLCTSSTAWAAREVQGRVEIADEKGVTILPLPCEVKVYAAPLGKSKSSDTRCSRHESVDSDTGAFSYLVPADCENIDLELWVEIFHPPFSWELQPEMRLVIWPQKAASSIGLDPFRIIRPSQPSPAARQAHLEKAAAWAEKDWSAAVELAKEASRGGDIRFTMESIDFLEKSASASSGGERNLRFKSVYEFIAEVEPDLAFNAPENRFRLAMRKANAASAADLSEEALLSASRAQAIFPRNGQAPTVAFIVLSDKFQTSDPAALSNALEKDNTLFVAYQDVYDRWQVPGKPSLVEGDKTAFRVSAEALSFARENVAAQY